MAVSESDLEDIRNAIEGCPVIDNHAHNLLRADRQDRYSLITCVTEARDEALKDTPRSLAHLRAVKQLRELYDCDSSATWSDLVKKRSQLVGVDADDLTRRCLSGTQCILIDDGLDDRSSINPVRWHDQFTPSKNRRIVRIETLAAEIMKVMYEEGEIPLSRLGDDFDLTTIWPVFLQAFENAIADEIKEENVAGFKSVVCYRTGLDVAVGDEIAIAVAGQDSFRKYLKACARGEYRIQYKGLNDCLVISTCKLISASYRQTGISKPLQFHTGLGDNDISLLKSNPAHLQPLIARFHSVNFVLLHSSYPYTREAGYLATVYKNAYLDVGEIFPMVSIEGQLSAIKQSMELTPFSKLLWSTDGHHFPETYWLANKQIRHVLYRVFKDLLIEEVITKEEVIEAVRDILFENSNKLYHLNIALDEEQDQGKKPLTIIPSGVKAPDGQATTKAHYPPPVYDSRMLSSYLRTSYGKETSYFIVQWVDYLGTIRSRSLPYSSFRRLIGKGNRLGISKGNLGTLQDDTVTAAVNTTGQIYVEPDLNTLRPIHWKDLRGACTVLSSFRTLSGSALPDCPRSILTTLATRLLETHNLSMLVGFELEITLLRLPTSTSSAPTSPPAAHAWGTLTPAQASTTWPLAAKIAAELTSLGVPVEHFHAESGAGQYEFALAPLPPVAAVDVLVQARQAIRLKAERYGYRATVHAMPVEGTGNGLHAHVSLNTAAKTSGVAGPAAGAAAIESPDGVKRAPEPAFWAGVLRELRAITALTLPNVESYRRVADDHWTGGTWVAWGTENRKTPLRRVLALDAEGATKERWEVRCMDGMGNPYLALAAIVGAGLKGLGEGLVMEMRDCELNPSRMTDEQGQEYGITEKLPLSLTESLEALGASEVLKASLGEEVVERYIVMKKAEQEKLVAMEEESRRAWLLERY